MDRPTCKTCLYWNREGEDSEEGTCRRYPPTGPLKPYAEPTHGNDPAHWNATEWNFPVTYDEESCGEHTDFPAWLAAQRGQGR